MKSIIKTSKRGVVAILALCMLFGIARTYVNVSAMAAETTVNSEEIVETTVDTTFVAADVITIVAEGSTVVTDDTNMTTNESIVLELMPMMARGCGYNLPDDFLNGGNWTDNYSYIESHLIQYHGGSSASISANLHSIKSFFSLPANYNCIFDMTGGVYNQNGEYLGNLLNW